MKAITKINTKTIAYNKENLIKKTIGKSLKTRHEQWSRKASRTEARSKAKIAPKSQKLASKSHLGVVSRRLGGFRMSVEAEPRDVRRQKPSQGEAR